jgi:hypothetical protein
MTFAFNPATAPRRAADVRRRLLEPSNSRPDHGITMRNGWPVRRKPEPLPEPPPEPTQRTRLNWLPIVESDHVVDLNLRRLIRDAEDPVRHSLSQPKCRTIQKEVAAFYLVSMLELLSHRRAAYIMKPRHVAIYLTKILTSLSLPQIGWQFGGRDHTSIIHAVRKIEAAQASDERIRDEIQLLKMKIRERTCTPLTIRS